MEEKVKEKEEEHARIKEQLQKEREEYNKQMVEENEKMMQKMNEQKLEWEQQLQAQQVKHPRQRRRRLYIFFCSAALRHQSGPEYSSSCVTLVRVVIADI